MDKDFFRHGKKTVHEKWDDGVAMLAGDAMLSLIALCLKSKFHKHLSMLISSLGAAESVNNLGNKEALNKIKRVRLSLVDLV